MSIYLEFIMQQNAVEGIPNLSLPDICSNAPKPGMAFCEEHCSLLLNTDATFPTGLREFLKYCKAG